METSEENLPEYVAKWKAQAEQYERLSRPDRAPLCILMKPADLQALCDALLSAWRRIGEQE